MNILRWLGIVGPKKHDREALSIYSERIGSTRVADRDGVKVVDYRKPDGSFDYEAYKAIQTAANKAKIDWLSVQEVNIAYLCDTLKKRGVQIKKVLCHGTRNGAEQKFFHEATGAEVLGTEISDTATQFPMTIQWDFHEVKPEWNGAWDVVFSNSWDHAFDPRKAIGNWLTCVRPGGALVVEWSKIHAETKANPIDPFRATRPALLALLESLTANGGYAKPEIIGDLPDASHERVYIAVFRK
ncbi:MAG TPA: class I SAM-dependent methyltransferase [Xanthobacteraceae bacterium]|nr:class I SAM-dependent methyltransferase [Xanthobacteraceae bacterium]